jgi:hypothetical protein
MKTKRSSSILRVLTLFILLAMFFSMLPVKSVQAAKNTNLSVGEFLNFDGTLNLTTGYSGNFDISNYGVTIDLKRGPVLKPLAAPDVWTSLGTGVNSDVYSMALSGSSLYAGGAFTDVSTLVNADRIAKWNGSSWSAFGSGAGLNDWVKTIAVSGTDVYVGGVFTDVDGDANADYIAKWNGSTWSALGSTPLNGFVYSIAVSGSDIYVGGNFANAGGISNADRIAKWNGSAWSALGAGVVGTVYSIAISGTDVYAGGVFTNAGEDANADYIAKWNGATWSALGTGLNSDVHSIAISGTNIYAGGSFLNASGIAAADFIAKWDGSVWSALGATSLSGNVESIAVSGTDLYAGGNFLNAGGNANADYLAKWNGASWSALGTTPLNDVVFAVATNGSEIYAGGKFLNAGGDANADYIAKFVPVTTSLVNSVLPTSRSVVVGTPATIYHTVVNAGTTTATNVALSMSPQPLGTFTYYQTICSTNAMTGAANPLLTLAPGAALCYALFFTPSAAFSATSVQIRAQSDNAPYSTLVSGVNTWLLRSSATAGPDIIALTTTTDFHQVACSGTNAFAVALSNVGAAATGDITASVHTGGVSLPITYTAFETTPATGVVIGDHIFQSVVANDTRTMVVTVTFNGCIAFNPGANRIFIDFRDSLNNVVGSTSTAISTNR